MKKFILLLSVCLFVGAFAFADVSHPVLIPVKANHHKVKRHHAHKATKHHTPKRRHNSA